MCHILWYFQEYILNIHIIMTIKIILYMYRKLFNNKSFYNSQSIPGSSEYILSLLRVFELTEPYSPFPRPLSTGRGPSPKNRN